MTVAQPAVALLLRPAAVRVVSAAIAAVNVLERLHSAVNVAINTDRWGLSAVFERVPTNSQQ